MSNQKQRRLMQESLDESLKPESRQQLYADLDHDPETAAEYRRLRQVDRLLRDAPFEHAPKTLALNIMARLAEGLKQPQLSHISGLALALALALVTLVLLPMLVGFATLLIGAVGSATALAGLMNSLVRVMTAVFAGLEGLVESAQTLLSAYPQAPVLIFALVPTGLFWWLRSRGSDEDAGSNTAS